MYLVKQSLLFHYIKNRLNTFFFTIYLCQILAGGDDDAFIVFKIQPSPTEDYIMDENQVAKPKPGKVAKVRQTFS